jgi:hypothetical protein
MKEDIDDLRLMIYEPMAGRGRIINHQSQIINGFSGHQSSI